MKNHPFRKNSRAGLHSWSPALASLFILTFIVAACGGTAATQTASEPSGDAPAAVVWNFLNTVQSDSSVQANAQYLSPALQADISSGHPIPELLAVQNTWETFGVDPSTLLDDGQHAIVTAGLNYGSPILRTFVLDNANGGWAIETIISYSEPLTEVSTDINNANQVLLQYGWDLASGAPDAAYGLLTSDAQALTSQDQLAASASGAKQFSVTNLSLLSELQDRMIYEVGFWVVLNGSSTNWTAGQNIRFVEMLNTPDGWRIANVSNEPLN